MEQIIVLAGKPRCRSLHSPFLSRLTAVVEFDLDHLSRDNLPSAAEVAVIDCGSATDEGLRLLTELKAGRFDLPVIIVSRIATDEVVAAAFRRGAREYFEHPLDEKQLADFVEFLLEAKRKRAQQLEAKALPIQVKHPHDPAQRTLEGMLHRVHPIHEAALREFLKRLRFCPNLRKQVGMNQLQYMNMARASQELSSAKKLRKTLHIFRR